MSKIELLYDLEVKDKDGNVILKTKKKPCKSFVKQFLQLLEVQMYPSVSVSIKDYVNTDNAIGAHANNLKSEFGAGVEWGIMVGTGTTAVTLADYTMETVIAHGVGAGELSYGAHSKTTSAIVSTNVDFILTRTFNNGSGSTINVTEAGIYCLAITSKYNLIVHEVFSAVPVGNGQTLTLNFTFRTSL